MKFEGITASEQNEKAEPKVTSSYCKSVSSYWNNVIGPL